MLLVTKKQKQKTHFKTKSIIKRQMFTAIKNQNNVAPYNYFMLQWKNKDYLIDQTEQ